MPIVTFARWLSCAMSHHVRCFGPPGGARWARPSKWAGQVPSGAGRRRPRGRARASAAFPRHVCRSARLCAVERRAGDRWEADAEAAARAGSDARHDLVAPGQPVSRLITTRRIGLPSGGDTRPLMVTVAVLVVRPRRNPARELERCRAAVTDLRVVARLVARGRWSRRGRKTGFVVRLIHLGEPRAIPALRAAYAQAKDHGFARCCYGRSRAAAIPCSSMNCSASSDRSPRPRLASVLARRDTIVRW